MINLIGTIPWKGSESQILALLAIGSMIGYGSFIAIAKKDTARNPKQSIWASNDRAEWK